MSAEATAEIFISYSRRDAEAAERLRDHLIAAGLTAYLDKHDIAAGEDWRSRLGGLIEAADAVVFLISPDSIASEVCDWEVNHAELTGKRIIPVVCRDPAEKEVPARLKRLNYVFMRTPVEMESQLGKLRDALAVDIGWVRAHTRYGEQALEWDRAGRPSRLLLRGTGIGEAEGWRDGRPTTAPELTEAQAAFIGESRRAATRRQRGWIAGSSVVAVASIALAIFAFVQQRAAEASRKETVDVLATSDFRQGTQLVERGETAPDGMAFLARSARAGNERAGVRLWTLLQQRRFWVPGERSGEPLVAPAQPAVPDDVARDFASVEMDGQQVAPASIAVSADGSHVFTATGDPEVRYRVWRRDGTPLSGWVTPPYVGNHYVSGARGVFSGEGRYLAVEVQGWRDASTVVAYDNQEMVQLAADIRAGGLLPQTEFVTFPLLTIATHKAEGRPDKVFIVAGSSAGDAAAFELQGTGFTELARNSHRAAVTAAAVDPAGEWLMSSGADGTTLVSTIGIQSRPVGGLIRFDDAAVGIMRTQRGLALIASKGQPRYLDLMQPPLRQPPLPASVPADAPCLASADLESGKSVLEPSGISVALASSRQATITPRGGAAATSPLYAAPIALVCASTDGRFVTLTTTDFRTEAWMADFTRRLGSAIDERPFFGAGSTPEKTDWVKLSPDGTQLLLRSSFWQGPNEDTSWVSLWDLQSGLPLIDRIKDVQYDFDAQGAAFEPATGDVLLVRGDKPLGRVVVNTPANSAAWLPGFAEATAGVSIGEEGLAREITGRPAALADGLARIAGD